MASITGFIPELRLYSKRDCRRSDKARIIIDKYKDRVNILECKLEDPEHAYMFHYQNGAFYEEAPHIFIHGYHLCQREQISQELLNSFLKQIEKLKYPERDLPEVISKYWRGIIRGHAGKHHLTGRMGYRMQLKDGYEGAQLKGPQVKKAKYVK